MKTLSALISLVTFCLLPFAFCLAQSPAWQLQSPPLSQAYPLFSVYFPDVNTGYAVGYGGTILKTSNAGSNWTAQIIGTTQQLRAVYFSDANTGYAVGAYGTFLKTTNGGTNWTAQTIGTGNHLLSVYFSAANNGHTVGYGGTILKTTDGGTNWTVQSSGTANDLWSVYFTDANTGYAVGDGGTILKTTTGGVWAIEQSDFIQSEATIYPNPFTKSSTIEISDSRFIKGDLLIFDFLGQAVHRQILNSKQEILNLQLPSGIYFYQVSYEKTSVARGKIIKQ